MKPRKLTRTQMKEVWFSARTNEEASDKCGIPIRTLYNYFGPSGRPAGWKRKASR